MMKIQKRSESNVLTNHPFKTAESRGYVNAGARQLLKPLTFGVRGFSFAVEGTSHIQTAASFETAVVKCIDRKDEPCLFARGA